jgi:integrase
VKDLRRGVYRSSVFPRCPEISDRLKHRENVRRSEGIAQLAVLKPTTVHREFRVLRRIFNVAVKKKLSPSNPCSAVEFPTSLKGLFRPHCVIWSEQQRIESCAPQYLVNAVCIITETGLRVYKELTPMRKDQVDLVNTVVWIPESKTPNGLAEVSLTAIAVEAFCSRMEISGEGRGCFHATVVRLGTSRASKMCGVRPCGELAFRIFGCTTFVRPTLLGLAPPA